MPRHTKVSSLLPQSSPPPISQLLIFQMCFVEGLSRTLLRGKRRAPTRPFPKQSLDLRGIASHARSATRLLRHRHHNIPLSALLGRRLDPYI